MDVESLLEFGFKEFPVHRQIANHDRNWQFCQRDNRGKRFYVQVRFWKFSKYPEGRDAWDAYVQFNMRKEPTFNVTMFVLEETTPAEVVDFFQTMWEKLECEYYEELVDGGG